MRQISIYGAGHLTKSLLTGFRQTFPGKSIKVYNRTADKVIELQTYNPEISRVDSYTDLCSKSSFVFLIIPASGIIALDNDFISALLKSNSVIVSCANSVSIDKLNEVFPNTKVVRLLPNINWQIKQGLTIYQTNLNVSTNDLTELLYILSPITKLIEAKSDLDFDMLGKLTSCGPGLFTKIIDQLLISFDISDNKQKQAVYQALISTMNYLIDSEKSPDKIISEVANKGGLTESGIIAAEKVLPDCFDFISKSMNEKLLERKQ
jgi:pyrroline-5-carboxylate reductase